MRALINNEKGNCILHFRNYDINMNYFTLIFLLTIIFALF